MTTFQKALSLVGKPPFPISLSEQYLTANGQKELQEFLTNLVSNLEEESELPYTWAPCEKQRWDDYRSEKSDTPAIRLRQPDNSTTYAVIADNPKYDKAKAEAALKVKSDCVAKTRELGKDASFWHWKSGRGNLVTRISKFYADLGLKLKAADLSEIGNICNRHLFRTENVTVEFTDNLNWRAGEFGDENSCFWGGSSSSRIHLAANGALAFRVYLSGKGYARCWVLRHNSTSVICFNAYGINLEQLAVLLAKTLETEYHKVDELTHSRDTEFSVYINGGRGYLIGGSRPSGSISLSLKLSKEVMVECANCGKEVPAKHMHTFDNLHFCPDCVFTCTRCGHIQRSGRSVLVAPAEGDDVSPEHLLKICRQCHEELQAHNAYCRHPHPQFTMATSPGGCCSQHQTRGKT